MDSRINKTTFFNLPRTCFDGISVIFSHRWPKRNMRVCMGSNEFETYIRNK